MRKKILFLLCLILFLSHGIVVNAFSIQSYISVASVNPIAYGYDYYGNYGSDFHQAHYTSGISNSKYVIFRNAVKDGVKTHDLIIYPFYFTSEAAVLTDYRYPTISSITSGCGGYKMIITEHVDNGIGSAIDWNGMIGFVDLDESEYVILPSLINTSSSLNHVGINVTTQNTSYGWKYTGKTSSDGALQTYNYNAVYTEVYIPKSGYTFYYGSDYDIQCGMNINFDSMKNYIETNWPKYDVTYIDVVNSVGGYELGRQTKKVDYTDEIKGFDIGSDTSDNAYYENYYLNSDTSATVTGNGVCVYRIFKECLFDISGSIYWVDKNDKLGLRPNEVTLNLYRDGELYQTTKVDTFNSNNYIFKDLKIYNKETNIPYSYAVEEKIPSVYGKDGAICDSYIIKTNIPNDYDFTNTLHFPASDIAILTEHKTDIIIKTNLTEKISISLNTMELFINEDLNMYYGELTDKIINIFTDNIGEIIKNIPAGKYEINTDSSYTITDMTIVNNKNIELINENGKWYLIVESTPENGFGIININLFKNETFFYGKTKIQNYFNVSS